MMQTGANTYFDFLLLDAFTADRNNLFDGSDAWVISKLKKSSIREHYISININNNNNNNNNNNGNFV